MKLMILTFALIAASQTAVYAGSLASELVEAATKLAIKESAEEVAKNASKAAARESIKSASRATTNDAVKGVLRNSVAASTDDVVKATRQLSLPLMPALSKLGEPLAVASTKLSPQQSRRLSILLPDLEKSGKASEVLSMIAKNGKADQVVDFLWRNKGTLVGTATVAALLSNPEAAIAAGAKVTETAIATTGDSVLKPMATYHATSFLVGTFAFIAVVIGLSTNRFRTWLSLTWYLFKPLKKSR